MYVRLILISQRWIIVIFLFIILYYNSLRPEFRICVSYSGTRGYPQQFSTFGSTLELFNKWYKCISGVQDQIEIRLGFLHLLSWISQYTINCFPSQCSYKIVYQLVFYLYCRLIKVTNSVNIVQIMLASCQYNSVCVILV